jgi:hypothetical protein
MIDLGGIGRGAVRKYWLAQDFIASVATDDIRSVEFAGGDIHRAIVTWNSGARVCVNRGATDWTVDGHTLPQFGYWAKHGAIESSIERIGGAVAEQSRSPGRAYFNSRVFNPAAPLAIVPRAERVEHLGGRQFRLTVQWEAQQATAKDRAVFYAFSRTTPGRRALTEFTGGGAPARPTSQWQGTVATGDEWTVTVPAEYPLGEYEILVGLYDPKNRGNRERLRGDEDPRRRYRIGKLVVEGGKDGGVTGVRLEPPAQAYVPAARGRATGAAVDFGPLQTTGAVRLEMARDHLIVTPLPDGDDFELRLRLAEVVGRRVDLRSVEVIDAQGAVRATVAAKLDNGTLALKVAKTDFAYRINFR